VAAEAEAEPVIGRIAFLRQLGTKARESHAFVQRISALEPVEEGGKECRVCGDRFALDSVADCGDMTHSVCVACLRQYVLKTHEGECEGSAEER
jgi:hypothetical protein